MLKITSLTKEYRQPDGSTVAAISPLSLNVKEQEFVAVLGPSGCGKTTFLRIIAGLEQSSTGDIAFMGNSIREPSAERGMVFQQFTSFPWLTVYENIAFGLRLRGESESSIGKTVEHYLKITELERFRDSFPRALSGGMQQRVAIARTLANQPRMLLLDEPFGALDVQTRSRMQEFLAQIWEEERKTVILVTHDIEEAIFLADRVLVMSPRPMSVKQEFQVSFPRPRIHKLKMTQEFFEMKKEIMELR